MRRPQRSASNAAAQTKSSSCLRLRHAITHVRQMDMSEAWNSDDLKTALDNAKADTVCVTECENCKRILCLDKRDVRSTKVVLETRITELEGDIEEVKSTEASLKARVAKLETEIEHLRAERRRLQEDLLITIMKRKDNHIQV
ncbi:hypothetical protein ETB97_003801 [Aspergillus alliaceus]|uniref:Uncharacterized protein n=1 Tax=Petromyces alliaceus TaxID=209559 RepID=A0A8H6E548_PETAA|nr:hypothetical protein ETB97_003801 [Aspergillus burnettii]